MFVAIIRILFGFIAAALVAGVVQVMFVAGPDDILAGDFGALSSRLQDLGLLALLAATQSAVFSAPFVFLAAAFAAWLPIRSGVFFVIVGVVIALAGFFAQYVGEGGTQTILNRYALTAYVVSGFVAGLAYWIVAVPKARPSAS
jgi:hypothetical protein